MILTAADRPLHNPPMQRTGRSRGMMSSRAGRAAGRLLISLYASMTRSTVSAIRFIQELSGLASRLAERDIVVASLHCEWGHFGSWKLEIERGAAADAYGKALLAKLWDAPGPDVVRFWWDGKEKCLTVDKALTRPLCGPGPWKRQMDKALPDSETAVRFVEEYLGRWREGEA